MSKKKLITTKKQPVVKKATRQKRPGKIPEFASREEEAQFWDTHSLSDYVEQLSPVEAEFAKGLSQGITVRFDPKTMTELRVRARTKGVGPTTLIRMWVLERLQEIQNPT
jgi:predicted HicB family RNase H-like nuclease